MADELVLLDEGRIRPCGPPAEVLRAELLTEVYGIRVEVDHDPRTGAVRTRPVGRHAARVPRPPHREEPDDGSPPRAALARPAGLLAAAARRLRHHRAAGRARPAAPATAAGRADHPHRLCAASRSPCPARPPASSALEWNVAEHAVSLGVMPVGVADVAGYGNWVKAEPLDAVGHGRRHPRRAQHRLDRRAAPRPDPGHRRAAGRRRRAAGGVRAGGVRRRRRRARTASGRCAATWSWSPTATGKQAEAAALLAAFDAKLADGQGRARGAGRAALRVRRRLRRGRPGLDPAVRQGLAALRRDRAARAGQRLDRAGRPRLRAGRDRRRGPHRGRRRRRSSTSPTTATAATRSATVLGDNAVWSRCRSCRRATCTGCPTASGCSAARRRWSSTSTRWWPHSARSRTVSRSTAARPAPRRSGRCASRPSCWWAWPPPALLAAVHVTQGTADVGVGDLVRLLLGGAGTEQEAAVVVASRVPRLLAGLLVGVALGRGGRRAAVDGPQPARLAGHARASTPAPTCAGAGRRAALGAAGAVRRRAGVRRRARRGRAGAGAGLRRGRRADPAGAGRLGDRAGAGLGHGHAAAAVPRADRRAVRLGQRLAGPVRAVERLAWMAPLVLLAAGGLVALAGRLDIHGLGDDAAAVLGVHPRRTRLVVVLLAVAAVGRGGDRRRADRLRRAGRAGDRAAARAAGARPAAAPGAAAGVGAVRGGRGARGRRAGAVGARRAGRRRRGADRRGHLAVRRGVPGRCWPAGSAAPARCAGAGGALARLRGGAASSWSLVVARWPRRGGASARCCSATPMLLTGDLANWVTGRAGPIVTYVLDARVPRVLAALVAGAALAVAGAVIQAGCRNPLAEPGILGVTGGAGLGAVLVITLRPGRGHLGDHRGRVRRGRRWRRCWSFGLAAPRRAGLRPAGADRGRGVGGRGDALITVVIVLTDPCNVAQGADLAVRLDLRAHAAAGRAGGGGAAAGRPRCSGGRTARWTCWRSTTTPRGWSGSGWTAPARCCSAWPAC